MEEEEEDGEEEGEEGCETGVKVGVGDGIDVGTGVKVGVGDGPGVNVAVGVSVGKGTGVSVGVFVGREVGVALAEDSTVKTAVEGQVGVGEGVEVGVGITAISSGATVKKRYPPTSKTLIKSTTRTIRSVTISSELNSLTDLGLLPSRFQVARRNKKMSSAVMTIAINTPTAKAIKADIHNVLTKTLMYSRI